MYKCISSSFAKSMGGKEKNVHSIASVDEARSLSVMNIVVKIVKRQYLFWNKIVYRAYDFQLDDLLLDSHEFKLHVRHHKKFICKWKRQLTFSLKGKLGAEILEEIADASLSADDEISIQADLGDVSMVKIEAEDLMTQLSGKQLNLANTFIQQIRHNKKKVLCLVQEVYMNDKDAEIKRVDKRGGNADVTLRLPSESSSSVGGSVEDDSMKDLVLSKDTPVAYKILELQVDKVSGSVVPCLTPDIPGGFMDEYAIIGNPPLPPYSSIDAAGNSDFMRNFHSPAESSSQPASTDESRSSVITREHALTTTAHQTSLEEDGSQSYSLAESNLTFKQLKYFLSILDNLPKEERDLVSKVLADIPMSDVKLIDNHLDTTEDIIDSASVTGLRLVLENARFTKQEECCSILKMAGFQENNGVWLYPVEMSPMFVTLNYIFGAVAELPDDIFILAKNLSKEVAVATIDIIGSTLGSEPLIPPDALDIVLSTQGDPACIQLLNMLGYPTDGSLFRPASCCEINELNENVFWLLCALHKK